MVAEGDRLGPLEVGVARQNHGLVPLGQLAEDGQQLPQQFGELVRLPAQIHPQIQRHLVVPGAGGVQLFPQVPQSLGQHLFHKHVDVLRRGVHGQRPGLQIPHNALQPRDQPFRFRRGQNPLRPQHLRMGHAAPDVLPEHPRIEADGGVEVVRRLGGLAAAAPGP